MTNVAKLALGDISRHVETSRLVWSGIDYEELGRALKVQQSVLAKMQNTMSHFTASYRNLTASFEDVADVVARPSFVLPGATQEVSITGYALEVLHPEADIEAEGLSEFGDSPEKRKPGALLAILGKEFVDAYRGAVVSLNGDNPDRSRHVLSSLRTLSDDLIRKIAPKDRVREWIVERGYDHYLDNGNPTRRAQILYISKDLEDEPLTKFIEADTKAVEELYSLYNRLHSLGTGISQPQLRVIVLRTESFLEYMLRVREW